MTPSSHTDPRRHFLHFRAPPASPTSSESRRACLLHRRSSRNMSDLTANGPAPRQVPNTLLGTLQGFTRAQETRRSLATELESALSSFLTSTPTPLADPADSLSNLSTSSGSTCASEAVRPPNEAELGEVLRIGFLGLMEIRDEVEELEAVLRMAWKREDLADVLKKVEGLEAERLKEVSWSDVPLCSVS